MQVAVSDRRRQFDGWNVGFINFIGLFDLVFHSRCNNDYYNVNGNPTKSIQQSRTSQSH